MRIRTTCYGTIEEREVPDRDVIAFPRGLPGFEEHKQFALLGGEELQPFVFMQSLADPWTAFVTLDLNQAPADYGLSLAGSDQEALGLEDEQPLVLGIVTLRDEPEVSTLNELAPVVVNRARRLGRQVIRTDSAYEVAKPLIIQVDAVPTANGTGG